MTLLEQVNRKAACELVPLGVQLDLTHRCHQRCRHCYLPEAWRRGGGPGPELSTARVKDVLDQLAAAGTFLMTITGGEVFLRPDIFAILEHARRLDFSISLMTTGTLIDRDGLKFLKDLGLHGLLVTLFGLHAPVHDGITGVNGSWEKVMQTVRMGKELGVPMVLNCIAFPINASELRPIRQFARQADIPLRLDYLLMPRWDGQPHASDLVLTPQEKSRILEELEEEGEQTTDPTDGCAHSDLPKGGCGAGWRFCYITPIGEVWPCIDIPVPCGRLTGNGEQLFEAIWRDSPVLKKLRPIMTAPKEQGMLCKVYQNYI